MGRNVLAFDFGASSGRAMLGSFDGGRIAVREVHRFSNDPVTLGDAFLWDIPRLFLEIETGLRAAQQAGGAESLGIDTWGVDYGLIDRAGRLMGSVYHYRDGRNARAAGRVLAETPIATLYARTGIQYAPFNTVFQLRAVRDEQPWLLENAARLLMLPDLFGYFLTGQAHTDYSEASTTGLLDVRTGDWDRELIGALGYPQAVFGEVSKPGAEVGRLLPALREQWMAPDVLVLSVASHDTASAVAAVPEPAGGAAYISCGTWSLLGTELDAPLATPAALRQNFTNEGGYGGKIRFLKNIMGLWLIQESRRHWKRGGEAYSFAELERLAGECAPYRSLIDVEDERFSPPGDIPGRIRDFCRETNQPVPQSVGEVVQCIYGSLALKYRHAFESLSAVTVKRFGALHMVGGGIKDRTLLRLAATLCGVPVVAGPVEATVAGNVAVQLIALGEIKDIAEARRIVRDSFPVETLEPEADGGAGDEAYGRYRALLHL